MRRVIMPLLALVALLLQRAQLRLARLQALKRTPPHNNCHMTPTDLVVAIGAGL